MKKHIDDLLVGIDEKLDDGKELNVIMTNSIKYKPVNEFVILFADSLFLTIDNYKLNTSDIKVILKIISYAQYGNLIQFSRKTLAEDCGLRPSHLSRSLKNLHEASILITVKGNMYLNPQVLAKGSLKKFSNQKEIDENIGNLIEIGAEELKKKLNIGPNIESKKMIMKKNKELREESEKMPWDEDA